MSKQKLPILIFPGCHAFLQFIFMFELLFHNGCWLFLTSVYYIVGSNFLCEGDPKREVSTRDFATPLVNVLHNLATP